LKRLAEFGDFRLDLNNLLLLRAGEPVRLPPKSLDTLVVLLQAYPDVVSREALRSALWPDVTVDDSNLTQNVYVLRKTLGAGPDGRHYVETVPKRGYRFTVAPKMIPEAVDQQVTLLARKTRKWPVSVALGVPACILIALLLLVKWPQFRPVPARRAQPEAVALYERGRALWKQRRMQTDEAENCFRSAIRIDPSFTLAYVGLADLLAMSPHAGEAENILRTVLKEKPDLAAAHATAGFIAMVHRWNWQDAGLHFDRAVQLDPRYVWARQWRALFHSLQGRHEEALRDLRTALQEDPASVNLLTAMCSTLYRAERPYEGATFCRTAIQIDPHFLMAHQWLIRIYSRVNAPEAAMTEFASMTHINDSVPSGPRYRLFNAALQRGGLPELWREWLREIESDGDPYFVGEAYAFLGQREQALQYLERSCERHGFFTVFARGEPAFAFVRDDPRFLKISKQVGLSGI
jgi:DNA-binding winged helix-turn-helix (wHTH) protein/tetratricopeptide (TPR) repeat protein